MASFQAKMGRDRLRMREKKIIVPIHSNPTRNWELKKKTTKKWKKLKNIVMASFHAKTGREWSRKREKKSSRFDQFLPDPEYRIPKKIQNN